MDWNGASELKQMEVLLELDRQGPAGDPAYLFGPRTPSPPVLATARTRTFSRSARQMLPDLKDWWSTHAAKRPLPFVDVFCETGAFNLAQTRLIFSTAQELGFPLKVHADEFENLGGARLAIELGAASADHLVKTSPEETRLFGSSDTVAVSLPLTPFGLNEPEYTPAKEIIAGGRIAGAGFRPESRHRLERQHAVCYRAGLPRHAPHPGAGHHSGHHQRRGCHPAGGAARLHPPRQAG